MKCVERWSDGRFERLPNATSRAWCVDGREREREMIDVVLDVVDEAVRAVRGGWMERGDDAGGGGGGGGGARRDPSVRDRGPGDG